MEHYSLNINGDVHETDAEPFESLLDVLREKLRLTGSKKGCDEGECGSCTVLLDGKPVLSCILLVSDVRDRELLTIALPQSLRQDEARIRQSLVRTQPDLDFLIGSKYLELELSFVEEGFFKEDRKARRIVDNRP